MAGTGLPLYSHRFGPVRHTLDPALVAGLLTATRSFADQAIGSELKDLVLENEKLHSYQIAGSQMLFTVHIDHRVDIAQLDPLLESSHDKLREVAQSQGIELDSLEIASFNTFQRFVEAIQPVLDELSQELDALRQHLTMIYDETSFDDSQLTLLSKVPEIVPHLTKNQTSLSIRDLRTRKMHFQQLYSEMEYSKASQIYRIIDQMAEIDFFTQADLTKDPAFLVLGGTSTAVFKIPEVDQNQFVVFKDHTPSDQFNNFKKLVVEIQRRVQSFYS